MAHAKARIELEGPVDEWLDRALAAPGFVLLPITPRIAAVAGRLAIHGDPADRLVVATAIAHGSALVTKDTAIRAANAVATVW
jgi:PIN domain nuclease of toxin-antitoxin system